MPFQVSLSIASNKVFRILLGVDPSDIFAPCLQTLSLAANVTSGRIYGHTFLWELASGASVLFTSPVNQLSTTCDLLGVSTDRTFNFWVDKNRPSQQLYHLYYWGTATETTPTCISNNIISEEVNIPNNTPDCSSICGVQAIFNSTNPVGQSIINPSNINLIWNLPTGIVGLYSIIVQQLVGGSWVDILSIMPTSPQVLSGITNHTYYRIKTIYVLDHRQYDQYSCNLYVSIDEANYNGYVDEILISQPSNILPQPVVNNFTLLTTDSVTNELVELWGGMGGNILPQPIVNNFILLTTDSVTNELVELWGGMGGNVIGKVSVAYFGGIVIGG